MAVDAIGNILSNSANSEISNSSLNQEDFIKLFLTELNFQDPLEPVDNKEFLAQMAAFSNIEQGRQTLESIQNLVLLNSTQQSVGLLGKTVQVNTTTGAISGTVSALNFQGDGTSLTIKLPNDSFLTGVRMSEISLIQF